MNYAHSKFLYLVSKVCGVNHRDIVPNVQWKINPYSLAVIVIFGGMKNKNQYRLKRKEKNKSREEIFYQMKVFFV